ncbi:uncharacterized protein BT62DRAFT_924783 [Guyanagaster necrorhizus]|uniref:Uncharacterized protein n=1 Tax=Guyanagaster necrorhizus TaxID=856835 RepID=A0A9P8AL31_9AGAR|nr:uncharacterized protein BT62DRAFT_924783 [Guyanagaster necrorhizus MCA 3950]KAG7439340.1 hypothetical protein BT62DRAFT_924783 [Guyanagaster necrorhizus MCA 3950]
MNTFASLARLAIKGGNDRPISLASVETDEKAAFPVQNEIQTVRRMTNSTFVTKQDQNFQTCGLDIVQHPSKIHCPTVVNPNEQAKKSNQEEVPTSPKSVVFSFVVIPTRQTSFSAVIITSSSFTASVFSDGELHHPSQDESSVHRAGVQHRNTLILTAPEECPVIYHSSEYSEERIEFTSGVIDDK